MKFPFIFGLFLLAVQAQADTVTIAVASNFARSAAVLSERFERTTEYRVRLVIGSSGKLYAQIVNGAPFDVFLSADSERPGRLEKGDFGIEGTRFTYAIGQLVLWSRDPGLGGGDCLEALTETRSGKIALANPRLAPYGAAAKEFLLERGLWEELQPRLVFGENVAQALQFAESGNARFGFVAKSHLQYLEDTPTSCLYALPASTHLPIEQQALVLSRASHNAAAQAFIGFLQTAEGRAIIAAEGYALPAAGK